jgi:short-subunit dehydrogenase
VRTITAGSTALITGASSGIGRAFAERLAADGADLVLVARRTDTLEALAAELRARHSASVAVIAKDLNDRNAAETLVAELKDRRITVDALINNAGLGIHGDLGTASLQSAMTQIAVNINSLTALSTLLLPEMLTRGSGAIVNVASTAGFQPVPHMAVYSASKAYVLTFTRALWRETRGTGVDVLALCPGATETAFFATAGEAASVGSRRTPEQVVETGLRALRRGQPSVVDGRGNAFVSWIAPRLPERLALNIAERSVRP